MNFVISRTVTLAIFHSFLKKLIIADLNSFFCQAAVFSQDFNTDRIAPQFLSNSARRSRTEKWIKH